MLVSVMSLGPTRFSSQRTGCGSPEIPPKFLRRAVFRGRALAGLRFTDADWEIEAGRGGAGYLLTIPHQGIIAGVRYGDILKSASGPAFIALTNAASERPGMLSRM